MPDKYPNSVLLKIMAFQNNVFGVTSFVNDVIKKIELREQNHNVKVQWFSTGTDLEFYSRVAKGLKLKDWNFWEVIPSFWDYAGDKLLEVVIFLSFSTPSLKWLFRLIATDILLEFRHCAYFLQDFIVILIKVLTESKLEAEVNEKLNNHVSLLSIK